ncbi:MAG: hypothetical protein ABII26_00815, partial [Pseudomonadota bacterium]
MTTSDSQKSFSALNGLRDQALLLDLGQAYLCKESILQKMGAEMDSNATQLSLDIQALKKRYPGKFAREIDTDE